MKSMVLPAGTEHLPVYELAYFIAKALFPEDDATSMEAYESALSQIKDEVHADVRNRVLAVKDPTTLRTIPIKPTPADILDGLFFKEPPGLHTALVAIEDIRAYVAGRGLKVLFQFTIDEDGGTTSFNATQAQYDEMMAERKAKREARQAQGRYTMYEAAQVLSAVNGRDAKAFLFERMVPAANADELLKLVKLVVIDPVDGGPVTGRQCRPYDDWTTPANINDWLTRTPFDYRWPIEATAPQAAPVATAGAIDGVEPAIDFDMLAQRHELIAAFGTFTGLDESWFDNLRDRPRLLAARKVKGTGGRNYTEPLFCPYMVMQWLTTKPRQGDERRPMSAETGWRRLKTHFLKVYSQYQIGDPNNHSAG